MMDGLTIMLGVFINLLCTLYNAKQPLFNNLHAAIPPLDGQTLPESRQKIEDLRQETCQHVAVKV